MTRAKDNPASASDLAEAAALKGMAAYLGLVADWMNEQAAARLRQAGLSELTVAAADWIRQNPGAVGKQIAAAIGCHPDTVRGDIARELKRQGFTIRKGSGGCWPPGLTTTRPPLKATRPR